MERIHRKVGLSQCGNRDLSEAQLSAYREGGIEALELSCALQPADAGDLAEARRNAERIGIELWTAHLPFSPFHYLNIASLDKPLRDFSVAHLSEVIRRYSETGTKTYVIHPSSEPNLEEDRERLLGYAAESLVKLADVAASVGGVIAVEDLPRTCLGRDSRDIATLLAADERLTLCFDTNHLLSEPIADFVRAVGGRMRTVHVSDYDFVDERHWLPGEGDIDWVELLDLLDEVGYRGPFLYELGLKNPKAPLVRERELLYSDFARNARELENREKPTVFAKRA